MDTYHQPSRYMRPPPPSVVDHPHHHHLHQQPPPRQPAPWFPGQFQYHPSQSPSPMPPHHHHQQQQWAPPPPPPPPPHQSDHPPPNSYPPPPLPPYPPHPVRNQFPPPPRPHFPPSHPLPPPPPPPPPSHPHSQVSQSFAQPNQEWGNPNWGHHQGWDYSAHNNEEDWAARARAWAAAKAAMDNQHLQSQFTPVGRQEEQNHYHDQYPQALDPNYPDIQHQSFTSSSYQQFPVPGGPPQRPPVGHVQDSVPISSGPSSYVPDSHPPFAIGDGTATGDSSAVFPHQENLSTSPSIHLQEVPYSYSSVAVKEVVVGKNEQLQKVLPVPIPLAQEGQILPLPSVGTEQPFTYSNQTADPKADLSDQPLDFAPRFNRDHDPNMQSSNAHSDSAGAGKGMDPVAAVPSMHTWTPPVGSGLVYPPAVPPGPQHDPSITMPPIPGHAAPLFGRLPGPSFQQTIPSVSAPFGLGAGAALHPTTAFPVDAYNLSTGPERPKKASVPNWLREEIIKKKAVITSSCQDHPREESQFMEEEGDDKSFGKVDHADAKSIDSSRSTEEEDDDEDDVEAARTAAINQEIKRIVTEVLLKVTDELFDEIATKVLSEDDMTIEVDNRTATSNNKVSQISPSVLTPKASAKVLIPVKDKETEVEAVSGKSSSSSPGDVLGLASYASEDDDDDDEVRIFSALDSQENSSHPQSSMKKLSEHIPDPVENGGSQIETEECKGQTNIVAGPIRTSLIEAKNNGSSVASGLSDVSAGTDSENGNVGLRTRPISGVREDEDNVDAGKGCYVSGSNECVGEKAMKPDLHNQNVNVIMTDSSQNKETRIESNKNNRHETKRDSSGKKIVKEEESIDLKADARRHENHRRHDERNLRKENTDNENGTKDRTKRQSSKSGEKAKGSDSRERTAHLDVKEGRKETETFKRANAKAQSVQKRERSNDEKEGRSRHKLASDPGRHKRRRSSSISSRGRTSKDNSVISHANASSDEASEDSKRNLHSRKSNLSRSPTRSRRRQVSRSPHSKHSQRRHSPYPSLEATRGRRSRSRSPVRRQR